jgi:hypothetical protein
MLSSLAQSSLMNEKSGLAPPTSSGCAAKRPSVVDDARVDAV